MLLGSPSIISPPVCLSPFGAKKNSTNNMPRKPPGVKRSSWTRSARVRDARSQRAAWSTRNARVRVPRNKLGFPTSMSTKLRFSRREDFDIAIGNAKYRTIRANDLRDPVYALGGDQPRGFDQFMAIYKTFTVRASKISVNFMYAGYFGPSTQDDSTPAHFDQRIGYDGSNHVPAQIPVICGITSSADDFGAGLSDRQMEKDRTSWKVLVPTAQAQTVSRRIKVSDFFGKHALTGSEGYSGSNSASPTEEVFYHVWAGAGTNDYVLSDLVTPVRAFITVEYECTFTEPKVLLAS